MKKSILFVSILLIGIFSSKAQSVKDIDGNEYNFVKCGIEEWISANLNVSHFRNGDIIPEANTAEEWKEAASSGKPAWCYINNDSTNSSKTGKLYNWYAINDPRGLAPAGWHIPVNGEWKKLVDNLLGISVAGPKLKSKTGWKSKNGTNNIKFEALPVGYRDDKGNFMEVFIKGLWWSNSEPVEVKPSNLIYSIVLSGLNDDIEYIKRSKGEGLSVRCVKDKLNN